MNKIVFVAMELISTKIVYISNTDINSVNKNDIDCGTLHPMLQEKAMFPRCRDIFLADKRIILIVTL